MKISYNWLKDYCDCGLPAHELAEKLSNAGFNVDTYEPHGADYMLDVEVTTNRPDCLSHLGLAREVAALTAREAARPEVELKENPDSSFDDLAAVQVDETELCPHYTARLIRGVSVAPSPDWLQQRLATCGIRPVNNVVDITNYVMLECGQPLHAFDYALLNDSRIVVRRAQKGETITTIDGDTHELDGTECVIADGAGPVAVGGVMGGIESEIGDTTVDVLLEAARFDQRSIRLTSHRHGLISDSSYRYERGIDPEITEWASMRATQLIAELAGGTVSSGMANLRFDTAETPSVTLRRSRLRLVLGLDVAEDEIVAIFSGLGLDVEERNDDRVTVSVPTWRPDLRREVDLIEEVARLHGYGHVSETTDMPVREVSLSVAEQASRKTRRVLATLGFNEAMTYSLVSPDETQLKQPWHDGPPLELRNPVSQGRTHLRLTNMGNLLQAKAYNQAHGTPEVDLYELGTAYLPTSPQRQPEERVLLTALSDRSDGLRFLKTALHAVCNGLGADVRVREDVAEAACFAPGESLLLHLGEHLLGCMGVLHPDVAERLDLRNRPALMEVDFRQLVEQADFNRPYSKIPTYPATDRDLAIVVKEDVLWADIESVVRQSAPDILESMELFDIYHGEQVPPGCKSVAFRLTFRRTDQTITAEEAEHAREAITDALGEELDATLR